MNIKRVFAILLLSSLAWASPHKMFPANHDSVALENHYADGANLERFEDMVQVASAVRAGTLTEIPITVSPKLPAERRYVRPAAASFMLELDARFYLATGHFLIVDSAVRPASVQRNLARRNRNAAPATGERASSHERGTTFDLAKKMASNGHVDKINRAKYRWLLTILAYYQGIGRIHIIEERACLHIMVREDSNADHGIVRSVQAENLVGSESDGDELHAMQTYDCPRR